MSSSANEESTVSQQSDAPRDSGGGGGSGGPEVREVRKRKSSPGDSETGPNRPASRRKDASGIGRRGNAAGQKKSEDSSSHGKDRILRSSAAKKDGAHATSGKRGGADRRSRRDGVGVEEKTVLRSRAYKRRKDSGAHTSRNGSAVRKNSVSVLEKLEDGVSGSDAAEQIEVHGNGDMKAEEGTGMNEKEAGEETQKDVDTGAVEGAGTNDEGQMNCEGEVKLEKKMAGNSDGSRQGEESEDSGKKEVVQEADSNGPEDKKDASSGYENHGSGAEQLKEREKITAKKKRTRRSGVARQRKGAGNSDGSRQGEESEDIGKREVVQVADSNGPEDEKDASSGYDNHGSGADQLKDREKITAKKKRTRMSGVARQRKGDRVKDAQAVKKRITRSCSGKRREEADGNEKGVAINKADCADLMICEVESNTDEKRITRLDTVKQMENKGTDPQEVSGSKPERKRKREDCATETTRNKHKIESVRSSKNQKRQKDCSSPEKNQDDMQTIADITKRVKKSAQRIIERSKGNRVAHGKNTKVVGRIAKAFSRNRKLAGFRREDKERRKALWPTNRYPVLKKTTSAEKMLHGVGCGQNSVDTSTRKKELKVKGESGSTSETPVSTNHTAEAARNARRAAKQKVRDQIKNILLNAGWTIDLRPRAGRNYDDSVYMSPIGHSYWSIVKAYEVYEKQMNMNYEPTDEGNKSSKKPLKKSAKSDHNNEGTISTVSFIPKESLSMLKKVMVNKRRSKAEMKEVKMKLEGNKKARGAADIKHPRSKHLKNKVRKAKEKTKKIKRVDSSNKSIVSYMRKKPHIRRIREKRRGLFLLPRSSNQGAGGVYVPYLGKRTIFSWMIDLEAMPASGKLNYMNHNKTQAMLDGWITRNGIHCNCCSRILTVSMFEIHAGSEQCQPYQNIYLEGTGMSLLQCQINAWEKQDESVRQSFYSVDADGDDPNDDTCGICGDGGDLICCDSCPSTFHLNCLGIQMLPPGDWHCMNCSCRFCGLASSDAQDNDVTVASMLSCYQCEKKYHDNCVPEEDAIPVCAILPCISFCGQSCKKLFQQLQKLIGVKNDLEAGFSCTLLQRLDEDFPESVCGLDQWVECNSKIAVALAVMDECFVPIVDKRSGIDMIHNVVYNCGSNFSRLNYRGFYTFILEREDEVISAASLRIHGTRLAEMPFIGTRNMYRRKGMCRRLLNGIESALLSLNIGKLIIPAISELMDTWINAFGFRPIDALEKQEVSSLNMLVFPGTGLLSKQLLKEDSNKHCKPADQVGKAESDRKQHYTSDVANESSVCSFVGLELDASNEAIVPCGNKVDVKSCALDVLPSDIPRGSNFQGLECKSSKVATENDLSMLPEVVCHDGLVVAKISQVATIPETSENGAHDNNRIGVRASVAQNLLGDTSATDTSTIKCTSADATAADLHNSAAETSTAIHAADYTLMPQDLVSSTLREPGGDNLQGLSSCVIQSDETAVTNRTIIFPAEHGPQISTENGAVNNHNIQQEVGKLPSFADQLESGNPEIIDGSLIALPTLCTPIKHFHVLSEDNAHNLKVHHTGARPEPLSDDENTARCATEVSKTSPNVPGKESPDARMNGASCNIDGNPVKCSVDRSLQYSSEIQQNPKQSLSDLGHTFVAEKLHSDEHKLVNTLNDALLPESNVSFDGDNKH